MPPHTSDDSARAVRDRETVETGPLERFDLRDLPGRLKGALMMVLMFVGIGYVATKISGLHGGAVLLAAAMGATWFGLRAVCLVDERVTCPSCARAELPYRSDVSRWRYWYAAHAGKTFVAITVLALINADATGGLIGVARWLAAAASLDWALFLGAFAGSYAVGVYLHERAHKTVSEWLGVPAEIEPHDGFFSRLLPRPFAWVSGGQTIVNVGRLSRWENRAVTVAPALIWGPLVVSGWYAVDVFAINLSATPPLFGIAIGLTAAGAPSIPDVRQALATGTDQLAWAEQFEPARRRYHAVEGVGVRHSVSELVGRLVAAIGAFLAVSLVGWPVLAGFVNAGLAMAGYALPVSQWAMVNPFVSLLVGAGVFKWAGS